MRGFCSGLLLVMASACAPTLDIGSDVMWATDHESGTLDDWSLDLKGGVLKDPANSTVVISSDHAHSGRYSLLLTDLAKSDTEGAGIYRELSAPPDAYYSAWYYVPDSYQANSQWTIQKFRSRVESDPDAFNQGHDLNLRTLPDGQVVLYVFSHKATYLQAPLADPPAFVPVKTWFHLEVFFSARTDETGKMLVWLDDRLVYDLENRITAESTDIVWNPCNIAEDIQPAPPKLFVDDAGISLSRVTREGRLQ